MFCEACGKPNPNDAAFCEGCGAKMSLPPPVPQQQVIRPEAPKPRKTSAEKKAEAAEKAAKMKEKVKNLPKKVWVLSGAALAVLLAFFIFLGVGRAVTSPKTIAKRYFSAMRVERDFEKAFGYLLLEPSEFVNKESLAAYLADDMKDNAEIVKFVAKEPETIKVGLLTRIGARLSGTSDYLDSYNDALTQSITVEYVTSNGDELREYIKLFDTGKRSLLFWKKYTVSMNLDEIIQKNIQIVVPKGSAVTVDGIALKEPEAVDAERYGDVAVNLEAYQIDSIFEGYHKMIVTNPLMEDYEDEVSFYSERTVECLSMELSQEIRSSLFNQSLAVIQNAITKGLAKASFSALELNLTANANDAERVQYAYENNFLNQIGSYISIKPKTFEDGTTSGQLNNDMRYACRVEYIAECVYTSWGGEQTSDRNFYSTLTWAYENGAWVIAEASF